MSKALVVDDSRTIRTIIKRILIDLGFQVLEAGNGLEGLKVMETEKNAVELVLADWNMPEMNGLELVKELRKNPEFASLKVIMVTTETEMSQMTSGLGGRGQRIHHETFHKRHPQRKACDCRGRRLGIGVDMNCSQSAFASTR